MHSVSKLRTFWSGKDLLGLVKPGAATKGKEVRDVPDGGKE